MFGLRAQVIAALLVVALLIVAVGVYVVRYLLDENQALTAQVTAQAQAIKAHQAAERALLTEIASKEKAHAEALVARDSLAAQLRTQRKERAHLVETVAEVRDWAEQRLPAHVLAGLHNDTAPAGPDGDSAAAPDGAAE